MERLSKLIAAAGVTSRRKASELIRSGRVTVDGQLVLEPGTEVDPSSATIEVDGTPLEAQSKHYVILNKPRGPLSAVRDDRGRRTVLDLLPEIDARLYPAGRLDANTEGVLLLTNDGDLTYRLTHPRYEIEKVYEAEVKGRPSRAALGEVERGMILEEGPTGPAKVRLLRAEAGTALLEVTVHAGRKRMVRRMLAAVGHPVLALRRTRIGPLALGSLGPGEWRHLTDEEVTALKAATEASDPARRRAGPEEPDRQQK
jgi:pseudouridine synthase